ncbi:MAG TPA: hypothetical protein VK154_18260 [Chitinophagales bacterium]|nr:hypothetical protein [Chitinophagales bacterium]
MSIDEEIYRSLHDDLEICRDYIRQISVGMVKGDVTKYPIFVATRGESDVDLGLPIVNRGDFDISWNFNASHLEEFVTKGVVIKEKAQDFIKAYKNPAEFMCVFVAEEGATSFVFMPYDKNRASLN